MRPDHPNFFAGPYIDRRAEAREASDWFEAALADEGALFLASRGPQLLVHAGDSPRIAFLRRDHPLLAHVSAGDLVLLGWFREARCLMVEVAESHAGELLPGASFAELRPLSPQLAGDEAGLLAYARALSIWRARARHCGVCGARTRPERAGHCLRCSNPDCAAEFFPRLDPAIIVLVSDGERALLGRQHAWPPGRYSTIAGFVEPGESLEDAVAREVLEETGVQVSGVRYDSSQPWPFPSSLMLGFHARAAPGSPVRTSGELEDARWFSREEVRASRVLLPPPHAISSRLIASWLEGRAGAPAG